jgi:hypothetical protein
MSAATDFSLLHLSATSPTAIRWVMSASFTLSLDGTYISVMVLSFVNLKLSAQLSHHHAGN